MSPAEPAGLLGGGWSAFVRFSTELLPVPAWFIGPVPIKVGDAVDVGEPLDGVAVREVAAPCSRSPATTAATAPNWNGTTPQSQAPTGL
jgi:hypothetical protein